MLCIEKEMKTDDIREQYRNSPEWSIVGIINRIERLEKEIHDLKSKPKRTRRKVMTNGSN